MTFKVYAVYDSKVEAYMTPFNMTTRGQAVRAWQEVVNEPQSQFNKHPGDFTLFEVAEYCDIKGMYLSYDAKINIGTALEYINKPHVLPTVSENKPLEVQQ